MEATESPSTPVNKGRVRPGYIKKKKKVAGGGGGEREKEFRLCSNDFGFNCTVVSKVGGYKSIA